MAKSNKYNLGSIGTCTTSSSVQSNDSGLYRHSVSTIDSKEYNYNDNCKNNNNNNNRNGFGNINDLHRLLKAKGQTIHEGQINSQVINNFSIPPGSVLNVIPPRSQPTESQLPPISLQLRTQYKVNKTDNESRISTDLDSLINENENNNNKNNNHNTDNNTNDSKNKYIDKNSSVLYLYHADTINDDSDTNYGNQMEGIEFNKV